MRRLAYGLCTLGLLAAAPVEASENGGSAYAHGAEGWRAGLLPPEGNYLINYTSAYSAGRLNDTGGTARPGDFRIGARANTLRLVHVTDRKILGANLAFHMLVPVVDLDVSSSGQSDHRSGIGDVIVNPLILGWHFGRLHMVAGLDIYLPTGAYDHRRLANIGRNSVTIEPALAATYLDPSGPEVSAKLMYAASTRNRATGYRSGDEVHVDFTAGWNFEELGVGLAGYYARQVTDDRRDGIIVGDGNRGEVFALGPSLRYDWGGVPLMLSWQHEFLSRNRPQGGTLWLKLVVPLGRR